MSYEFKDIVGLPPSNSLFQDDFFIEGQVPGESYTKRFSGAQLRGIEKQERLEYDNILRTRMGLNSNYSLPDLSATNYLAPTVNIFHGMTILDTVLKNLQDQVNDISTDGAVWGQISGTIEDQEDLIELVNSREPSITPGTPTHFWAGDKSFKQVTYEMLGGTFPHPTDFFNQPSMPMSGPNVISQITINDQGHVTGVTSRALTLNDLGLDTSNFVTLNTVQTVTAAKVFANITPISLQYASDSGSQLYTSLGFSLPNQSITDGSRRTGTIIVPSLDSSYTWTLPANTGTFAMLSDIPSAPDLSAYVPKAGSTIITGNKYFINNDGTWFSSAGVSGQSFTGNPLKIKANSASSPYSGFQGTITSQNLEDYRTWYLPNNSGTIALTSDLISLEKATSTDINNGTDDAKYVTSLSIRNSNIFSAEKAGQFSTLTEKTWPVDADNFVIDDSAASNAKKRISWLKFKWALGSFFYGAFNPGQFTGTEEKTTLASNDRLIMEDSAASYAKKSFKWSTVRTTLDSIYYGNITAQFYATSEKTTLTANDRLIIEDSAATYGKKSIKWSLIVSTIGAGGTATTLDGLSDVTITSPATGNVLQYNGSQWVNATVSGTAHDRLHAMTNSLDHSMNSERMIGRITAGTGAPEELTSANVLSFIGVSSAEWKNENITKSEIEAKLTGTITSHSHNYDNYQSWSVAVTGVSGTGTVNSGSTVTFEGTGGTSISRSGNTIIINSSTGSGGISEVSIGTNTRYFRGRDASGNAAWFSYTAPTLHDAVSMSGAAVSYLTLNTSTQSFTIAKIPITDINASGTASSATYLRGDGQWATPPGTNYTFTNSILNIGGTVALVNDSYTPGSTKYYGTNSTGVKGWYDYSGGSITETDPVFVAWRDTGVGNTKYYGTNSSGVKGWYDYSAESSDTYSWTLQAVSNPDVEIVAGNKVQFTIGTGMGLTYTPNSESGTYILAYRLHASIDDLMDVAISSPADNQILRYNGTTWINSADTALAWGDHAAAGYLESLTVDGTNNGITIGGTSTNPTLKIVGINQAGVGQITVTGSAIGVMLGNSNTTAAAGDHTHTNLHTRRHSITNSDDHYGPNTSVFYTNGAGQVTALALGTTNQVQISNGTALAFKDFETFDTFSYSKAGLVPKPLSLVMGETEVRYLCANGTWSIPTGSGTGMANPMTATGDMIYRSSTLSATRLPIGTTGEVLSVSSSGVPEWRTLASTFVMNITGHIVAGTNQVATLQHKAITDQGPIASWDGAELFLLSKSNVLKNVSSANLRKYMHPFSALGQFIYGNNDGTFSILSPNTGSIKALTQSSSTPTWTDYTFKALSDTPSYTLANAHNLFKVNASGTALEAIAIISDNTSGLRYSSGLISKLEYESSPKMGGFLDGQGVYSIKNVAHTKPALAGTPAVPSFDLGDTTYRWRAGYINSLYTNGNIYLGGGSTYYAGNASGDAKFQYVEATEIRSTMIKLGTNKFAIRYNGGNLEFMFNNSVVAEMTTNGNMVFMKS